MHIDPFPMIINVSGSTDKKGQLLFINLRFILEHSRFMLGHDEVPLHNTKRATHWWGAEQDRQPVSGIRPGSIYPLVIGEATYRS